MATGRTSKKHLRVYVDGYDMSGYAVSVGSLNYGFEQNNIITLEDAVVGALPGKCSISIGTINGVMDNTATSGMHEAFKNGADAVRDVLVVPGIRGEPIAGDSAFCAQLNQSAYQANISAGVLTATMELGSWDERADSVAYPIPWGHVLHANSAATAVNTSSGAADYGSATAYGGYMMYHVFTGSTGTVTIKAQDSTGGAWSDIPGLTSGELTNASSAASALVPTTAVTTTIDRYTRWQIELGTATSVTFALALVRGR